MRGGGGTLPEAFGQYRVVEQLGEGGMGVVYLAVSPDFRLVAVKALRPWLVGGDQGRTRFAREVSVMRRVRGTRVAEVLDADVDADPAYIVTRYVRGPALQVLVADHGPLQGAALTRLGVGLADALGTVHAAGLVHRDVKPGNVLMAGGEPVLIDFGLARAVDETRLTATGMVAGTPGYLAPETVLGLEPTPATDVHGWAATMAFAGTGRPPYGNGPDAVVLDRIRRGDHGVDGLPEPLADVVLRALHEDPAKRPTVGELRPALTDEKESAASVAPPPASPAAPPGALPGVPAGALAGGVAASGVPTAPPPPPHGSADVPTEAIGRDDLAAAAAAAPTAAPHTVGDDDATEAMDPLPLDRADDADTDEGIPAVSSRPRAADDTVVIARPPAPPTAVQDPVPGAPPPGPAEQPRRQQAATRPPQQHPYAGDGAPLRSWPARLTVLTLAFALVALAGTLPWVGAAVLLVAMIVGRMVWRIRRRMYERTVSKGAGKHDRLVVGLGAPVDLALAAVPALGQAVVALGAGVLVGLALNPAAGVVGDRTPLLAGAVTAAVVAWWGPAAARFRHGIRVLVAPAERHPRAGWIVAAVFFAAGWVAALLWEVLGTSWWPGSGPPNPLGL